MLWDVATKAIVAHGEPPPVNPFTVPKLVALAGAVFAVQIVGAVELRAISDGHLILSVPTEVSTQYDLWPTFGLATDGSYFWVGTHTSLRAYSPAGVLLWTRPGDYYGSAPPLLVSGFAAPTELRIARANAQTIELLDAATGASTTTPAFAGAFHSWFQDGGRFFTNVSTTVRIYSKDAVQEAIVALASVGDLGGQGGYFWTCKGVFKVATPSLPPQAFPTPCSLAVATVHPSGRFLAVHDNEPTSTLYDLDPAGVTSQTIEVPAAYPRAFAADPSGAWAMSATVGVVFDSDNFAAGKGALSCGKAEGFAGATTGRAAAGTRGGTLVFDPVPGGLALQGSLAAKGSNVRMTADGTVIALQLDADAQYWHDQSLRLFALPSAVEIHAWPLDYMMNDGTRIAWFDLARGASRVGVGIGKSKYTRKVTDLTETTTALQDQIFSASPMFISPDGTLVAAVDQAMSATQIHKNGVLVDAVTGVAAGWLDDDRLLVGGTKIHSVTAAANVATVSLPCTTSGFDVVGPNHVYCRSTNTIHTLVPSAGVWSASSMSAVGDKPRGAVAAGYVVYADDHYVRAEAHGIP